MAISDDQIHTSSTRGSIACQCPCSIRSVPETTDRRAVCGRTARTVRREGRRNQASSLPLSVNRTLLGNQESSRTERLSIHGGSRLPSRFSAAKSFGVTVQRITPSAELSCGPEPTEDCWATVNGTLLGNQESSSTERLSIHGGSRLPSRFSVAESFSVMHSVSPLRRSFHAARSQQRTVGPPSMERSSVTKNRPARNDCRFTVARTLITFTSMAASP